MGPQIQQAYSVFCGSSKDQSLQKLQLKGKKIFNNSNPVFHSLSHAFGHFPSVDLCVCHVTYVIICYLIASVLA